MAPLFSSPGYNASHGESKAGQQSRQVEQQQLVQRERARQVSLHAQRLLEVACRKMKQKGKWQYGTSSLLSEQRE